jgi:sulfoxide reductase heme-binding subunit YedZ
VALGLTAAHALALLLDRAFRFDALAVLLPSAAPYRPLAVGLGVLAAYAALVVHLSFGWRKRLGARAWRRLHQLSFVAYAAALVHGLTAGGGRGATGTRVVGAASALVIAALVARRVTARRRRGRTTAGAAARRPTPATSAATGPSCRWSARCWPSRRPRS